MALRQRQPCQIALDPHETVLRQLFPVTDLDGEGRFRLALDEQLAAHDDPGLLRDGNIRKCGSQR